MKKLVYYVDGNILSSGGFADRITGMAALEKFAKNFNIDFSIHFTTPFDFFEVFPDQKEKNKFDIRLLDIYKKNIRIYNLIDDNFETNINKLGSDLINSGEILALVFINNINPFIHNVFLNHFETIKYNQPDFDIIERSILSVFGKKYLRPDYKLFNNNFKSSLSNFEKEVLGIQIRVGGLNKNWTDPSFNAPSVDAVLNKVKQMEIKFDEIFICSDSLQYKNELENKLNKYYKTISFDNTPVHVDRSIFKQDDFISNSIGDHCLLRLCKSGLIISGGGYGRTAAILAGTNYHRIS
jgi:hypothetical protein